jgi:AcrR family transcriptional regulator
MSPPGTSTSRRTPAGSDAAESSAAKTAVLPRPGLGRRETAERRRASILDAALVVIARSGFAATTLRDVAAEASVAHGLLRHYFGSREALLAAAFDRAATGQIEALDEALDDPVVALLDYFEPMAAGHWRLWVDAWSEAPRNPELAATLLHHHRACEAHLRKVILAGVDAGVVTCDDADEAVGILVPLQDGMAVQEFSLDVVDRETADRRLMVVVAALLHLDDDTLARARQTGRRHRSAARRGAQG